MRDDQSYATSIIILLLWQCEGKGLGEAIEGKPGTPASFTDSAYTQNLLKNYIERD